MKKGIALAALLAFCTGCGYTTHPTTEEATQAATIPATTEEATEATTAAPVWEITTAATTEEATEATEEEPEPLLYEGYELLYSAPYSITENHLTRSNGVVYFNGHRETWYSTNEAAGKVTAWEIPDKHVADDGTIRDKDGFVCVASSDHKRGTIILTSVGVGKVYDCGCSHGTIDIYTNW